MTINYLSGKLIKVPVVTFKYYKNVYNVTLLLCFRWPLTMLSSFTHRVSGVGLGLGKRL